MLGLSFEVGKVAPPIFVAKTMRCGRNGWGLGQRPIGGVVATNLCSTVGVSNHRRTNLAQIIHCRNQAAQSEQCGNVG